jgi:Kdo2-lipid IVA lauroyltransferase/acyltransferase
MDAPRCLLAPLLFLPLRLVARLPWSWLPVVGGALGWLLGRVLPARRRIARRNLELCFPQLDSAERERLLEANVRASGIGVMETLIAWFRPQPLPGARVELVGAEFFEQAPRPVLVLGAHFTPIELGARLLVEALGQPLDMLVRRNNRPCLERIIDRARLLYVRRTLAKGDARALLRALREGPGVLYAPDQHYRQGAAHLPFFGVPASTLMAAPRLASSTGATILLYAFRRLNDGRYRLELEPVPADWPLRDAEAFTRRWLEWLELKVRRAPEQYLWAHRRFRSPAPGAPPLYETRDLRAKHRGE